MKSNLNFTPREIEILKLISIGTDRMKLHELLNLSEHTLNDHLKILYVKTNCHSYADMMFYCSTAILKKVLKKYKSNF